MSRSPTDDAAALSYGRAPAPRRPARFGLRPLGCFPNARS